MKPPLWSLTYAATWCVFLCTQVLGMQVSPSASAKAILAAPCLQQKGHMLLAQKVLSLSSQVQGLQRCCIFWGWGWGVHPCARKCTCEIAYHYFSILWGRRRG
jgi:hypothetical protein